MVTLLMNTNVNNQMLNNMLEIMNNGTDAQKQEVSNFFMQLNVQNRNQEKTKKFTKNSKNHSIRPKLWHTTHPNFNKI